MGAAVRWGGGCGASIVGGGMGWAGCWFPILAETKGCGGGGWLPRAAQGIQRCLVVGLLSGLSISRGGYYEMQKRDVFLTTGQIHKRHYPRQTATTIVILVLLFISNSRGTGRDNGQRNPRPPHAGQAGQLDSLAWLLARRKEISSWHAGRRCGPPHMQQQRQRHCQAGQCGGKNDVDVGACQPARVIGHLSFARSATSETRDWGAREASWGSE